MVQTNAVQKQFNLHFEVKSCEKVGEKGSQPIHRIEVDFGEGKTYRICSKGKLDRVFEIIEYLGREAERMDKKQWEQFKKEHSTKVFRISYKNEGDIRRVRLWQVDNHGRTFENVFRKTSRKTEYTEEDLKMLELYAKLWADAAAKEGDEKSPAVRLKRKASTGESALDEDTRKRLQAQIGKNPELVEGEKVAQVAATALTH